MTRIFNFSAGPSMLPEAVLIQAKEEMLNWQNSGMCVMEMSHRGQHFSSIAKTLEQDLRDLMAIPNNYHILFLQGGATGQFSFIPQNLLGTKQKACYVETGAWSEKAIKDAKEYCEVIISASAKESRFTNIPAIETWQIDSQAAYLHYTSNETIHGVEFSTIPDVHLPLVCDMSSNILSRSIDISRFGLIYAGSQKNMGPAGICIVIVREDLIQSTSNQLPAIFNYAEQIKNQSMVNTPVTYSWYLTGLVLQWLKGQGGIDSIEQQNIVKANQLYAAIDKSTLYRNPVDIAFRSRMNVPFTLTDESLEETFLTLAQAQGLQELKGHRSVGGMRASIYNAMPLSGVETLIAFMQEFERTH